MKYIRTLQNIKKLMDYAKSHVECYTDEYSGDCVDYKDDNFTIYTAIQDDDKMHVEIHTKSNGSATLYYEQDNSGEWELIKDYITDIDDIVNVNKALRQAAGEIKLEIYEPITMFHAMDMAVDAAFVLSCEKEDDDIVDAFRHARRFLMDHFEDVSYKVMGDIYFIQYNHGKTYVSISKIQNFYTARFEIDEKEYKVSVDKYADVDEWYGRNSAELKGDKDILKMFDAGDDIPADDIDKIEETLNQMADITDNSENEKARDTFNSFYDYIYENTDKTEMIIDEWKNESWLGINEGDKTISACINPAEKIVTVGYYEPRGNFRLTYDERALSKISIDGSINPLEKAGPPKGPPPYNEIH